MSRKHKFLVLPAKEGECAVALFFICAFVVPLLYSALRVVATRLESAALFTMGLSLRLVFATLIGATCGYVLWERRGSLTISSTDSVPSLLAGCVVLGLGIAILQVTRRSAQRPSNSGAGSSRS